VRGDQDERYWGVNFDFLLLHPGLHHGDQAVPVALHKSERPPELVFKEAIY
jgi:hypothetical protein